MCWPGLPRKIKEYPGLAVNLVTGIPAPDLIADRAGRGDPRGRAARLSLFSRRLGAMPMVVCAAKPTSLSTACRKNRGHLSSHSAGIAYFGY